MTETSSETFADDRSLSRLRFPDAFERAFQADYDRKILPGLRGGLWLLLALFALQGVTALVVSHSLVLPPWVLSGVILALLVVSRHPRFRRVWQPVVVLAFCGLAALLLTSVVGQVPASVRNQATVGSFRANTLLLNEMQIVIVGCALTRLRFFWFAAGTAAICALTVAVALRTPGVATDIFLGGLSIFVLPSLAALLLVAYLQERSARVEFLANHRLAEERNDERRARERTEGMLHVLGQAIGGIVHDLGNPLTSVRTGVETLRVLEGDGERDPALTGEILDIISDGALMLDYLRLSLLEQTRVLEGKPIPLQCEAIPLRRIVEASAQYQKPRLASSRRVAAVGADLEVQADAPKLTTVFMNLLGNALKYSDGDVRIQWRPERDRVVCAVLDRGRGSVGISRAQAAQLFVAFGRLDSHAAVEGTGLGLLSAQKIVEAHGGEVYIEGHESGTPASGRFSTARGTYPSMLEEGFCTAFVVTCPLALVPSHVTV